MQYIVPIFCDNGWYRYIKGYLRHRSPQTRLSHCRSGKALWFPFVNSCLVPLMKNDGWAARSSKLDNKSPHYIELSVSPALVPVCIGFSLSLQLSAWSGTVNDGFVLCSPCIKLIFFFLFFFQKSINKFGIYSIAVRQKKGSICCFWSLVGVSEWGQSYLFSEWIMNSLIWWRIYSVCEWINMPWFVSDLQLVEMDWWAEMQMP